MKSIALILLLSPLFLHAQDSLKELLDQYNDESVPYITVNELKNIQEEVILLDAREKDEYNVSHIPNAVYVGYNHFDMQAIADQNIEKNTKIVVYCSLGVRSEDISEKLTQAGYSQVFNLYGGIFEWKNNDFIVVNSDEAVTENVHACSKLWSKWLQKGKKVYSN